MERRLDFLFWHAVMAVDCLEWQELLRATVGRCDVIVCKTHTPLDGQYVS